MSELKEELYELIKNDRLIFDFIQEYALDGLWFFDLKDTDKHWVNNKFWVTLGYDPQTLEDSRALWKKIVFEEDLKHVKQLLKLHSNEFDFTYNEVIRYHHANGTTVWMRSIGIAIKDDSGKPVRMLGANIDITEQKRHERELAQQVNRYNQIIESSRIGTWEWNVQTNQIILNKQWARLLGYTLEELGETTIETWISVVHPDDFPIAEAALKEHLDGKSEFYTCDLRLKHKSGKWLWVSDRGGVVSHTPDGKPEWMMGSYQDITDKKELTEILRDQYLLNKQFVEQAPRAIALFDNNMCYLAASNQWKSDYGLQDRNIIGESHYKVFPDISDEWKEVHQRCLHGEVMKADEDLYLRENGTKQWMQWEVRPWYKSENKIGGLLMYTADITANKEREELLIQYQDLLKRMKHMAKIGTWEYCVKNQNVSWSDTVRMIHEVPMDYKPQIDTAINFYPEGVNRERITEVLNLAINEHQSFDLELQIRTATGKLKWVRSIGLPEIEGDTCVKVHGLFQDIDEKNTTLRNLAFEKEQFRTTFDHAPIGMAIVGLDGKWININNKICEILGYTKDEMYTKTFQDITYPEDLELDVENLNQLINGLIENYSMEKRYYHKNKEIIWAHLAVSLVRDDAGNPIHFVSQIQDITDQKRQQKHLENTVARLQGIQDASTQVAIIETDIHGIIKSFNQGAINLIGYEPEEVIDKSKLQQFIPIQELEAHRQLVSEQGILQINKQNELFIVANSGSYETNEWTFKRKDGSSFKAQLTITPIRNARKTISGYLGVVSNIDKLKNAESEIKSLLKVTQAQNDRLLNFAHIVSHNLRTHTGNFKMLLELLKLQHSAATDNSIYPLLVKSSDNLINTVGHLSDVVAMNTAVEENLEMLELNPIIESAISSVNAQLIELHAELDNQIDQSARAIGISAYLESIFQNLISNALKYKHPERNPRISITSSISNSKVYIKFKDNGLGIDLKRHGSKMFGMYKTFHGNKDARGIGLFITKNQIEAIGGNIIVESEPNEGTTFTLILKHEKN